MSGYVYTFDRKLELKELEQPNLMLGSVVIKINIASIYLWN